jgi:hypothetical protein
MVFYGVMEFKQTIKENYIVGNSIIAKKDLATLSTQTTMNMMVIGSITLKMAKESLRRHQLEKLKEEDTNSMK